MSIQKTALIAAVEAMTVGGISTDEAISLCMRALAHIDNRQPKAWVLITGHGTVVEQHKPACLIDNWQPLFTD